MLLDFEEIENLLKSGDLNECLEKIKKGISSEQYRSFSNSVLSEQSRLNTLQKKFQEGVISQEAFIREESKIRKTVISIIDDLKSIEKADKEIESGRTNINHPTFSTRMLQGVWGCQYSSSPGNTIHFWSLLPDRLCILNTVDAKTLKASVEFSQWDFDEKNQMIIQQDDKNVLKGRVKWISFNSFELTVFDTFKTVMIYEKIY